jgi:hypothetical protein
MSNTKGDIINGAYSKARISGLTKQPTAEDNDLALVVLEDMMEEYFGRNINVDYFFEDTPDLNTPHNVERKYWNSIKSLLAGRLLADFGKEPTESLARQISGGFSFLSSSTAPLRQTSYPTRQPTGAGNQRWSRYQRFYRRAEESPLSAETNHMLIDDIDDFVEHFDAYLRDGETVSSYTIEADTGLTILSDSLTSPDIDYQIQADGSNDETPSEALQVKIVATTSLGRQETRVIWFDINRPADIS